ncbi:hypothetical protein [Pseudohoeflea coraliihabitans]|uniref:Uncharacterized protein n=1 Tax=Pseudohoeflea coraliihabitans TaxID=2860393 RepID=A0ABS6WTF6_9HYPH|nr:hypothetical protein [Pseudohoeflea sp. DP4N28-3]MBW3099247.1 hypothetical protein [Pseudohoeflea sp. DP4N28-3]
MATVQTRTFSWWEVILQADPEFHAKRKDEKLFEFSNGREFRGNPNTRNTAYPDE